MASFMDKMKLNTAVTTKTKLDLSSQHITTGNFMQFNVAWTKELVPTEKITINQETFARMDALPVPTFGRANIKNRAFFVPFRTVFPAWNDFITDTKHTFNVFGTQYGKSIQVGSVPTVSNSALYQLYADASISTSVTGTDYDISTATDKRKFTAFGRQVNKILESLGYKVVMNPNYNKVYSALPLLCLAKVYCDWYTPSQYADDAKYTLVSGLFEYNSVASAASTSFDFSLNLQTLKNIFDLLARGVNYDSDYFVSAWDNPNNPNDGASTSFTLAGSAEPNAYIGNITGGNDREPALSVTTNANGTITQYGLTALKSLTDYMKRHQLVGARALDRYLARFGVNLSSDKLKRSIYIGSAMQGLQFGDVMSTADTETGQLGDYAGKGISYGSGTFEFDTDEYGMMIIVSSIVPTVGYSQGVDRTVMHLSKLDFYTPEFDNLGVQAIESNELFTPTKLNEFATTAEAATNTLNTFRNQVFGFTPRYSEYKIGRDKLTGDFRCDSINAGSDSWHMLRNINPDTLTELVHDVDFVRGTDADQYSRIFYNTDADASDKFKIIHNFNVTSISPMKSLYDTYEFEDKGKSVIEDVNGVKMN